MGEVIALSIAYIAGFIIGIIAVCFPIYVVSKRIWKWWQKRRQKKKEEKKKNNTEWGIEG